MRNLVAAGLVALFAVACVPEGTEGGPCRWVGGIMNGRWTCDEGLACYSAREPETCEQPNTHPVGDPCTLDANCVVEAWCPPGVDVTCTPRIEEGDACPSGVGCAAGLECRKETVEGAERLVCRPVP